MAVNAFLLQILNMPQPLLNLNSGSSSLPLIDAFRRPSASESTSTNFSDLFGHSGSPLSIQSLPFDLLLEMDEDLRLSLDETTIDSDRLEVKEVIGQGKS